nr:response regulator [Ktedonobacteraceae bacterium]
MDFTQWDKLLELIFSFLQAISWPLIILIIVLVLRAPLKNFLDNLIEFNLKAGPIETTAKRQQTILEISTSLGAAIAYHGKDPNQEDNRPELDEKKTKEVVKVVEQLVTSRATRQLDGATVLWVDDRPINNTYERQALGKLGIQFTISKSTEEAITKLEHKHYDTIISDMGRPPDLQAGYTLLAKVKEMHITTPFIIYAGSKRPEHVAEGRRKGAFGVTNDPQELFELVVDALSKAIGST